MKLLPSTSGQSRDESVEALKGALQKERENSKKWKKRYLEASAKYAALGRSVDKLLATLKDNRDYREQLRAEREAARAMVDIL